MRIAKGTQKKSQTKEQTKLIAQGIEKGISEYKKQQKVKSRERDKQRKKTVAVKANAQKSESTSLNNHGQQNLSNTQKVAMALPWLLLMVSWGYFLLTT
ncbi:DUF2956 domain-containing protein [Colwellia sp. 6M3]|uniref:DUF2956 family protein n=1 Tax=Colwellia sp. 6M3 TaxID=2759849 RepID=UPI0015F3F41A|nr:DUF2956 domain-containing protein [Colwellia sp. 6M3]